MSVDKFERIKEILSVYDTDSDRGWEHPYSTIREIKTVLDDPAPRTLANHDASEDRPCKFCGKVLWIIHPEAPFVLRWGHVYREDATKCTKSRQAGVWPAPKED